jgi:hypothetical protein
MNDDEFDEWSTQIDDNTWEGHTEWELQLLHTYDLAYKVLFLCLWNGILPQSLASSEPGNWGQINIQFQSINRHL